MQREHRDGPAQRQTQRLLLDRPDGVLEARVVELHHTRVGRAVARQTTRQVDVHDVKPAGAESEIERLGVDDHLIPRLRGPDERYIDDRRA